MPRPFLDLADEARPAVRAQDFVFSFIRWAGFWSVDHLSAACFTLPAVWSALPLAAHLVVVRHASRLFHASFISSAWLDTVCPRS